jgi:integrase
MMKRPPYLNVYKDRHGRPRAYFRKPGRPQVPLPLPLYSPEFWEAYRRAAEGGDGGGVLGAAPGVGPKSNPGSISALIERFYGSAEWKALAPNTKETYRRIFERFRQDHGDKPVALLETRHVNRLIDKLADRPAAAISFRKRLSALLNFAVADGWRKDNPVTAAKRVRHVTKGIRTWTEADIEAFRKRWPLGTPQRLAMEILLHTGMRRSDAVRLGRQHVVGNAFVLKTAKSQGRTELAIPIHPILRPVLASVPADHLTYIVTAHGAARSLKAFTGWFREAAHAAGLPPNSSPHGLRKAACRRLAEAGCSPHEIMSITGHKALAEVENYTQAVRRDLLAQQAIGRVVTAFPDQGDPTKSS